MTLAQPDMASNKRRRPRGSKILMILGGTLLVIAFVGGQAGLRQAQRAGDRIRSDADDVRAGFLIEVPIPGEDQVDLEQGNYTVYAVRSYDNTFRTTIPTAPGGGSTTVPGSSPGNEIDVNVTVTDPSGRSVATRAPGLDAVLSGLSGDFIGFAEFTVTEPGSYTVEGSGTDANQIAVGPTLKGGNIGRLISGGLFAALGFLLGGVGFILGLAGLIWFLVAGDGEPKSGPGGLYAPPGVYAPTTAGNGLPGWAPPVAPPTYPLPPPPGAGWR